MFRFDPEEEVLTTETINKNLVSAEGDLGEARFRLRTSTHVVVDVEANAACVLVLSDAFYPGWTAHIDRDPAQVFPAYHAFRAIVIPKGAHRVEFRYAPRSFNVGLGVALAAIALSIAGSAWFIVGRSRS